MLQLNLNILIPDSSVTATPKTVAELIWAAIDNRSGISAAQKADLKSHKLTVQEGFIRPANDVLMIDAFKGCRNGVVIAADWAASDFTKSPGGAEPLPADLSRHFDKGVDLDSLVLYQASGGDVSAYVFVTVM